MREEEWLVVRESGEVVEGLGDKINPRAREGLIQPVSCSCYDLFLILLG